MTRRPSVASAALSGDLRGVEDVAGQRVVEPPENAHRSVAGVRLVGHRSGVQVRRDPEGAVGRLRLSHEEVYRAAALSVAHVPLADR